MLFLIKFQWSTRREAYLNLFSVHITRLVIVYVNTSLKHDHIKFLVVILFKFSWHFTPENFELAKLRLEIWNDGCMETTSSTWAYLTIFVVCSLLMSLLIDIYTYITFRKKTKKKPVNNDQTLTLVFEMETIFMGEISVD